MTLRLLFTHLPMTCKAGRNQVDEDCLPATPTHVSSTRHLLFPINTIPVEMTDILTSYSIHKITWVISSTTSSVALLCDSR